MKHERTFTILTNKPLARDIYEMTLSGDASDFTRPGQFVNILLDGFFLRRPISVCDIEGDVLTLIYKTVGGGTKMMSGFEPGQTLDMLTALGNGFDTDRIPGGAVLIGGGVGCPPIYSLAKVLRNKGISFTVILGFGGSADAFYLDKFAAFGQPLYVTTVDGSICSADLPVIDIDCKSVSAVGMKGFVTDALHALADKPAYICACGPMPMLGALAGEGIPGQVSLEERMGCGFGGCMGCSIETANGPKRVCREGPVFDISEVMW